jgi:hypothetical protein
MADSKITALTALTAADPANDMIPIVDVSDTPPASGNTKRISINNILACSPTATLASLNVTGSSIPANGLYLPTTNTLEFAANSLAQYRIAPLGVFSWYDGAGGTRMTLNSTGLGVGVTPSAWSTTGNIQLPAGAGTSGIFSSNRYAIFGSNAYFNSGWKYTSTAAAAMYIQDASAHQWFSAGSGTAGNAITWTQAMTLDASGNLLVGKSSAVATAVGIQFQPLGTSYHTLSASTNSDTTLLVYSTGAAAYRFYVGLGGTVFATNTTISAISDQRLKENIQDIDVGLGAILALKPRKFDWKAGKGKDIKGDRGFIAQEFEQVFPNLVDEWKDNAPEGEAPYKSVRQDLIPVLVKAIQELTARVEALEA